MWGIGQFCPFFAAARCLSLRRFGVYCLADFVVQCLAGRAALFLAWRLRMSLAKSGLYCTLAALFFGGACALVACSNNEKLRKGSAPVDPRDAVAKNMYPALRGTIGEYAVIADAVPMNVEGYGIVAELPGTGS